MQINLWPQPVKNEFQPYMTTYLLDDDQVHSLIVVCPGGGYTHRAPHEGGDIAKKFNELGFHAVVVEYRVKPMRFPEPQQDAFRAIKLVRSHAADWKVDPHHVAICGFSSGGHLAASTGVFFDQIEAKAGDAADVQNQRPDALVLGYPVIDVHKEFGHPWSGYQLCGEDITPEMQDKLSLQTQVTEQTPPAFLWHTAEDGGVPMQNSLCFAQAIWALKGTAELLIFPKGPHGTGLGRDNVDIHDWPYMASQFLRIRCGF